MARKQVFVSRTETISFLIDYSINFKFVISLIFQAKKKLLLVLYVLKCEDLMFGLINIIINWISLGFRLLLGISCIGIWENILKIYRWNEQMMLIIIETFWNWQSDMNAYFTQWPFQLPSQPFFSCYNVNWIPLAERLTEKWHFSLQ